jgi:hypothetical protein
MADTPITIIPEFVGYHFSAVEQPAAHDASGQRWSVLCEPQENAGPLTHVVTSLALRDPTRANAERVAALLEAAVTGFHFTTLERRGAAAG